MLSKGTVMAENNEGDWGGEGLPLVIREHIREVDLAIESLVASVARMRSVVAGFASGAERERAAAAARV